MIKKCLYILIKKLVNSGSFNEKKMRLLVD